MKELKYERGDSRAREVPLAGFYRLRAGRHRIVFCYAADGAIDAVFMEERGLVYEVFEAEFIRKFSQ